MSSPSIAAEPPAKRKKTTEKTTEKTAEKKIRFGCLPADQIAK